MLQGTRDQLCSRWIVLAINCAEKCSKTLEIHRLFDDGDQTSYKFTWFSNTIDRECSVQIQPRVDDYVRSRDIEITWLSHGMTNNFQVTRGSNQTRIQSKIIIHIGCLGIFYTGWFLQRLPKNSENKEKHRKDRKTVIFKSCFWGVTKTPLFKNTPNILYELYVFLVSRFFYYYDPAIY